MQKAVNMNTSLTSILSEYNFNKPPKLSQQQIETSRPLDKKNLAILGCGYVGSKLAEYWHKQGNFVTGTTTNYHRIASLSQVASQLVVMKGDNLSAIQFLLQNQDTIVISVAPPGNKVANEALYENTYLHTVRNLVKFLNQFSRLKQIVYLSSCSVYGNREGRWVDETSSVAFLERRSEVLYEAEKILLEKNNDKQKVCVLRLGGIYGPGRELIKIFGDLAGMTLPGRGERFVNWIHRDDIIGAIDFARLNQLEGIYNLVSDSPLTIKQQIEQIFSHYNLPSVIWDSSKRVQSKTVAAMPICQRIGIAPLASY